MTKIFIQSRNMQPINSKFNTEYLSIPEGFEWNDIPGFAIVTGVNGAGKTQMLNAMQGADAADISLSHKDGTEAKLILAADINQFLNLEGLIQYKNGATNRFVRKEELNRQNHGFFNYIEQLRQQIANIPQENKIEIARLKSEIEQYKSYIRNNKAELKSLFIYIYEEELKRIFQASGKNIDELSDTEIREYANPYFNSLTEVDDFTRFIQQEEEERNSRYVKLAKESREAEIAQVRNAERAFETINRLFRKYDFNYFEMLDPFPSDGTRKGEVVFQGKKGEIVAYDALSSGEQMIVKFIIWAIRMDIRGNRINTMLLDEPDAHLHPSMCKMMVEILGEISQPKEMGGSDIRVIITTHSPSTVAFAPKSALFVMEKDAANRKIIRQTTTEEAEEILSEGLFTYDKAMKQFSLAAASDKNNILFVEGKTDVNHLNKAMDILGYNLDLDIVDMHDAGSLANFIKSTPAKLFAGKKLIALFDCDREGKSAYNDIKGNSKIIPDVKQVTATQCENKSFALTIQPPATLSPYCPIEFLYPFEYLEKNGMLEKRNFKEYKEIFKCHDLADDKLITEEYEKESGLRPYKVLDAKKNTFSENIKSETDKNLFTSFTATIDLIKRIIEL